VPDPTSTVLAVGRTKPVVGTWNLPGRYTSPANRHMHLKITRVYRIIADTEDRRADMDVDIGAVRFAFANRSTPKINMDAEA